MGYEKLDSSVISDEEAQLAGDVETSFVELRELSGAPPVATDKATSRLYVLAADGKMRVKDSSGNVIDLSLGASLGDDARDVHRNHQKTAATTVTGQQEAWMVRCLKAGTIEEFSAEVSAWGTIPAAGEDMVIDLQINGVTALVAPLTFDDTAVLDTPVAAAIDPAANTFAVGDKIEVIRTYTPGGAPTPMVGTDATVALRYAD